MSTRKPDFFILGAPKCGSTWLYHYLGQHPAVFMPEAKEPHYFNTDSDYRWYRDLAAYEALFEPAPATAQALGEASVWYLDSEVAVANILRYQPDARLIAMLRNPVEMAPSLHQQMVFNQDEDVADFAEAWALQATRAEGRRIPRQCHAPRILQYRRACSLGAHLQRLFDVAGRDRVLVHVMDDIRRDPAAELARAVAFLGLEPWQPPELQPVNLAKARRSPWLKRAVADVARIKKQLLPGVSFGLLGRINRWNSKDQPRTGLDPAMRAQLVEAFRDDVALLSRLLDRPLDHWLAPEPPRRVKAGVGE